MLQLDNVARFVAFFAMHTRIIRMKSDALKSTATRYFLEVARCGSIAEASERLHVANSAISRQIGGLEGLIGTALFDRKPHGMVLTAAGELLADYARKAELEADRVISDIFSFDGLRRGRVTLACTEGFALDYVPHLILQFQKNFPNIHFDVSVGSVLRIAEWVKDGSADIGLTFNRLAQKDIKVEYRQPAIVLAAMRPGHPLSERAYLSLQQLSAYPMVLPGPEASLRQVFDVACSRQGLVIEPAVVSNSPMILHHYVANSDAITLCGEVSIRYRLAQGSCAAVPIKDRVLNDRTIELQTLQGRTLPRVVDTFLGYLKKHLSETQI